MRRETISSLLACHQAHRLASAIFYKDPPPILLKDLTCWNCSRPLPTHWGETDFSLRCPTCGAIAKIPAHIAVEVRREEAAARAEDFDKRTPAMPAPRCSTVPNKEDLRAIAISLLMILAMTILVMLLLHFGILASN
jgi:hypothetical protein